MPTPRARHVAVLVLLTLFAPGLGAVFASRASKSQMMLEGADPVVDTVPLTSVAGLSHLALDGHLLYITDPDFNVIRVADLNTNKLSVFAGLDHKKDGIGYVDGPLSEARFNRPRGLCVHPTEHALYVADAMNYLVRRVSLDPGGNVTTVAGKSGIPGSTDGEGDGARFTSPFDILCLSDGSLLVTDKSTPALRRITLPASPAPSSAAVARF